MTRLVVPIVEGDGEVQALPVLLRRLAAWRLPAGSVAIGRPVRVRRDRFLNRPEEFQRMLQLAAGKAGQDGGVLVVLDADDDCPAQLGPSLTARVQIQIPLTRSAVVLANREYEAWFIASAASLHGVREFALRAPTPTNPDTPRNAKGWMGEQMAPGRYSPVADQAAFSAQIDLPAAYGTSRSFRKLVSAFEGLCT